MQFRLKILIPEDAIRLEIQKTGRILSERLAGQNPLFTGILKGGAVFLCDLFRHISVPAGMDFLEASSYDGLQSTGHVKIHRKPALTENRPLVLVEDILDTGRTAGFLLDYFREKKLQASLVCLLNKPGKNSIICEYSLFDIDDEFVVGYGLDYRGYFRNLPCIAILSEDVRVMIDENPEAFHSAVFCTNYKTGMVEISSRF